MTTKNSKNTHVFNISFLPLILLLLIIFGAGYFLMKGEIELPKIFKDGTEVRRIEGYPTVIGTSNTVDKQRLIITNKEQLAEFFKTVDSTGLLQLQEDINFEKEILLAVSTENNTTEGYEMKVRKLYLDEDDSSVLVAIRETRPGDSCTELAEYNNVALDIVAVSKTDHKIEFDKETKYVECN